MDKGKSWAVTPEFIASVLSVIDSAYHDIKSELEYQLTNSSELRAIRITEELKNYDIDRDLLDIVEPRLENDAHIAEIFKRINALNQIVYAANTRMSDPEAMNR
jgi:pyruvate-formate lyase-activating enzyme